MSETNAKKSVKKGFSAPVLKDKNSTLGNSDEKKEVTKKTKKEKDPARGINDEGKQPKKTKNKNKENKLEYNKEDEPIKSEVMKKKDKEKKSSTSDTRHKKPQVSMSDSQYEDIFNAVLSAQECSKSLQNTPIEEFSEPSEIIKAHTPTSKKGGSQKTNSESISEPATPSRQRKENPSVKENTPDDFPKTPTKSTPSQQQKRSVSPWGTHFSKHSSQASVILKEFHESQSSLLNSSTLMSPSTSDSDEGRELSQRSVCQLSQVSGYGSQGTYFKLQATDQRARLEELQALRNVGVWVFCCRTSCQKQRYLANVTDPQEVPDVWYCHMNPDSRYNSCLKPEEQLTAEEEEDMIYNAYTAGSVVWARVAGYPWWPAMVDDDPDLEQYYWLDDDFKNVTYYHVVFFDEGSVTRAWVNLKNIDSYVKNENKYKQRMSRGIDYGRRILVAKEQATDALTLGSYQRLKIYSFLARYKGPINTSESQANKTIKSYKLKGKGGRKPAKKNPAGSDMKQISVKDIDTKMTKLTKEKGKSVKRKTNTPNLEKPLRKKYKFEEKDYNKNNLTEKTNILKKSESSKSSDKCRKKKLHKTSASSNQNINDEDVLTKDNERRNSMVSTANKIKNQCPTSNAICNKLDVDCNKMDKSDCQINNHILENVDIESGKNSTENEGDPQSLSKKEYKSDEFSSKNLNINNKNLTKTDEDTGCKTSDKENAIFDYQRNNTIPETEDNMEQINTVVGVDNKCDQVVCSSEKIKIVNHLDDNLDTSETLLENFSENKKLCDLSRINVRDPRNSIYKSSDSKEEHMEGMEIGASTSYEVNNLNKIVLNIKIEENLSQNSKSSSKCRGQLNSQGIDVDTNPDNPNDYQEHRLSQDTIADIFAESEDAIVPYANLSQNSLPFEE